MPEALKIRFRMSCHAGSAGMVGTFSYQVAQNLIAQGYAVAVRDGASTPKAVSPKPAAPPSTRDLNTFVLVSMKNGCGLQADYELLQEILVAAGKTVYVEMARSPVTPTFRHVDVVIMLEIVDARWFGYGKQMWFVPNSEWFRSEWLQYVPQFSRVLCKTMDGYNIWNEKAPGRASFIGFESKDFYQPEVPRKKEFLHLAGGSCNKGTAAVLRAWQQFNIPYPLTVVCNNYQGLSNFLLNVPNVTMHERLPELGTLMNACQFHLIPSRYEGWGHVLHEGLGCGAVLMTTDAPPMNEPTGLAKDLQIPVARTSHERVPGQPAAGQSMTNMYDVDPLGIFQKVQEAMALAPERIAEISTAARAGFLSDRGKFRADFAALITEISTQQPVAQDASTGMLLTGPARDVVLVTTFYRAEYLWTCLQAIADAEGGPAKEVWVAQDHHTGEHGTELQQAENRQVFEHFLTLLPKLRWIDRAPHNYQGNSYNCLELYKEAYGQQDVRFVYLVEDDILVEKDFFRWHEAAQAHGHCAYMCSVGRLQTDRPDWPNSDDPNALIESGSDYTSWGSCWYRPRLEALVEHANVNYYNNMTGYIVNRFRNSPFGNVWVEQDGLIRRVLMETKQLTVSPAVKRAYHIGLTGYHRLRGHRFIGTLQERVKQLYEVLHNGTIPALRKDFIELDDIDVPRGSTPPWENLHVIQRLS